VPGYPGVSDHESGPLRRVVHLGRSTCLRPFPLQLEEKDPMPVQEKDPMPVQEKDPIPVQSVSCSLLSGDHRVIGVDSGSRVGNPVTQGLGSPLP